MRLSVPFLRVLGTSPVPIAAISVLLLAQPARADYLFTAPYLSFPGPTNVQPLAVGDVNLDGKMDLVCMGNQSATYTYPGRGDATLGDPFLLYLTSNATDILLADVNSDGRADLISSGLSYLSIRMGTADGHFQGGFDQPLPQSMNKIASGDIDNDGDADLVLSSNCCPTLYVYKGDGTGAFVLAANYSIGGNALDIELGDFNGDGKLDLATANPNVNSVSVLLGTGAGAFGPSVSYSTGTTPTALSAGDLNADGKLDLVVANQSANTLSVLRGTGTGSFLTRTDFVTAQQPLDVQLGDVNGDGRLDAAATCASSNVVSVLLGNGAGSLGARTNFGTASSPTRLRLVDMNGDGKLDLVVTNLGSSSVTVHPGNGNGTFGRRNDLAGGATKVALGDMNGDGVRDIVSVGAGVCAVRMGSVSGTFGAPTNYSVGTSPGDLALGDYNNDGYLDVATSNWDANTITLLFGSQAGTLGGRQDINTGPTPRDICAIDANGDGIKDLAIAVFGTNQVWVYLSLGGGAFAQPGQYQTGSGTWGIAAGDLNGDGKPDLATANMYGTVSALLNDGSGGFLEAIDTPTSLQGSGNPYSLALGDLDLDGRTDIAVTNNSQNTLVILIGNGDGAFGLKPEVATGSGPRGVSVADLDNDGWPDVMVTNQNSGSFGTASSFLGNGDGTLQPRVDYGTGVSPNALAIGDLNGDLLPDFVAANGGTISIHQNRGVPPSSDRAPVVLVPASLSIAEGHQISIGVSAADPDVQPIFSLTVDTSGLPIGNNASFVVAPGNASGLLTWNPTYADARVSPYILSFTASNALAGVTSCAIQVTNVDRVPSITAPVSVLGTTGVQISFPVLVSDPDAQTIANLTAAPLPAGAVFTTSLDHTTGLFEWTPSGSQTGTYLVSFTASNSLASTVTTSIQVSGASHSPSVTAPLIAAAGIGDHLNILVSALDPDGDPLASLIAAPLPPGASFSPSAGNLSGAFSWTPAAGQEGNYQVTFTATNALSGSATTSINVNTVNQAPIIQPLGPYSVYEGESLSFLATAVDPNSDPMIFSAMYLPLGATITPGGLFEWTAPFSGAQSDSVGLVVTDGGKRDTAVVYITVKDLPEAPLIVSITDVGNDQGRQVDVYWKRSEHDRGSDPSPVTGYALYRRIDPLPSLSARIASGTGGPLMAFPPGQWQYIATIPAMQEREYHYVAPTLADSTIAAGQYLTTFFMAAVTAQVGVHYDGAPAAGYSVDNLAPSAPGSFLAVAEPGPVVRLSWTRPPQPDLKGYAVYRGETADFAPNSGNLIASTTDSTAVDGAPLNPVGYYKVLAFDFAGNASSSTTTVANITGVGDVAAGSPSFRLSTPAPNPAFIRTELGFAIPTAGPAEIQIISVDGRLVRTVSRSIQTSGAHSVDWALDDERGNRVAAGVYFVRLRFAGRSQAAKLIVMR